MSTFSFSSEIKEEITVSLSKNIAEVFDFIAVHFLDNYLKWSPEVDSIEGVSAGEFGKDYQFRQVRSDKNIINEAILTVTLYEPYHHFAYANLNDHYSCHYIFEDVQGLSTNFTFIFHFEEIDIMMRPFAKVIRSAIQEGIQQTANNIKQIINNESTCIQGGPK
jgi:hypothetical protein